MSGETLTSAIARLEQAVARLEGAAQQRTARSAGLAESLAALEQRHGRLRARIEETIVRLDRLIDEEDAA
jgi:hypothetical protein